MVPAWRRALSYIRPQVLASYSSAHNPVLELTLEDGKLVLNTQQANFSYGSLQQAFADFFEHIALPKRMVDKVLILGLGAGSVAELVWHSHPQAQVVGVELDAVMVELGQAHFAAMQHPQLKVVVGDAVIFVEKDSEQYDLVVVDVFEELAVAASVQKPQFINQLNKLVAKNGLWVWNWVAEDAAQRKRMKTCVGLMPKNVGHYKTGPNHFYYYAPTGK